VKVIRECDGTARPGEARDRERSNLVHPLCVTAVQRCRLHLCTLAFPAFALLLVN